VVCRDGSAGYGEPGPPGLWQEAGRSAGETADLDLYITHETNGIRFTQLDRQHLNRTKYAEPEQTIPEEVNAA
jgi:hypothetical protein